MIDSICRHVAPVVQTIVPIVLTIIAAYFIVAFLDALHQFFRFLAVFFKSKAEKVEERIAYAKETTKKTSEMLDSMTKISHTIREESMAIVRNNDKIPVFRSVSEIPESENLHNRLVHIKPTPESMPMSYVYNDADKKWSLTYERTGDETTFLATTDASKLPIEFVVPSQLVYDLSKKKTFRINDQGLLVEMNAVIVHVIVPDEDGEGSPAGTTTPEQPGDDDNRSQTIPEGVK